MIRVGAHLNNSVSAGQDPRQEAEAWGMNCFQIMCGSSMKPYPSTHYKDSAYATAWQNYMRDNDVWVVNHMPYIANIGSTETSKWEMAVNSLIHHRRCSHALGLSAVLIHAGCTASGASTPVSA